MAQIAAEQTQTAPAKKIKRKKWHPIRVPSRFEARLEPGFAAEIANEVTDGERLLGCLQCGTCAGTCPMILYMDLVPRRIINMIREGARDDVIHSVTPWVCASCYSCTVECPKEIPITGIMHSIRRIALREVTYPMNLPIPIMEREFVDMVSKRGRSTESWLALKMYLRTQPTQLLRHMSIGQRLLRRGRMGFSRETIRDRAQLEALLEAVEAQGNVAGAQGGASVGHASASRSPAPAETGSGGAS